MTKRLVVWFDELCLADVGCPRIREGGRVAAEVPADQAGDWCVVRRRYRTLLAG
jgi:hypothetical protein